jgi:hypothetical protein
MKKRILPITLALILIFGAFGVTTFAADYSYTGTWDVSGSWGDMTITQNGNNLTGTYTWQQGSISGAVSGNIFSGVWTQPGNNRSGQLEFTMSDDGMSFTMKWKYDADADWTNTSDKGTRTTPAPTLQPTQPPASNPWSNASGWAVSELKKANQERLIPAGLNGADFTKPITRAEFAAVSVKLYENLSGKIAATAASNPFTDTNDTEVLKAYNVGLTAGTSAATFSPNTLLNREQAATMLTRVYKAAALSGWSLATDGNYTLKYTKPTAFADDAKISGWAKDSVYFMASKGIIAGTGNNMFSPRATTSAEEASNYASATREQAIAIAVRVVDNLKGTSPEIGTPTQPTPTPAPAPSGKIDAALVGYWAYPNPTTITVGYVVYNYFDVYEFYSDGTFNAFRKTTTVGNENFTLKRGEKGYVSGKYSCADGKLYATDLVYNITDTETVHWKDKTLEYALFTGERGEARLRIVTFLGYGNDDNYYPCPTGYSYIRATGPYISD